MAPALVAIGLASTGVFGAGPAFAAAPAPLVATGFLVVSTGSGNAQISKFKIDGSGEQKLTTGPAQHYGPSVSPDGTQVLFQGEEGGTYEVYRMNIDGTGVIPITKPPVSAGKASWAPDGKSIVYPARTGTGSAQIFTAQPDGSNPVQLTNSPAGSLIGIAEFSPDGALIAYVNTVVDLAGSKSRIWVMNAKDGSGAKALTAGDGDNFPAWYNADTLLFARTSNQGMNSAIFSTTLAGVEKPLSPADQWLSEPRPLPDGKSYGATHLKPPGAFEVVKVSRTDKAPLVASRGDVVLLDFMDGPYDFTTYQNILGDFYSVVYILAVGAPSSGPTPKTSATATAAPGGQPAGQPTGQTQPSNPLPLGLVGGVIALVLAAVIAGLVVRARNTSPRPLPPLPVPVGPGEPPLPAGGEVVRRPAPVGSDGDDCASVEGWDVVVKAEHREQFGFLRFSEEQAGEQATQYLRNRWTNEQPQIRAFLEEWSASIGCRPPCVKTITWSPVTEHWDELKVVNGAVVAYHRTTIGVEVKCSVDAPPGI